MDTSRSLYVSLMIVPSWVVITALVSVTDMRDDNFLSHLGGVHKTALQYIGEIIFACWFWTRNCIRTRNDLWQYIIVPNNIKSEVGHLSYVPTYIPHLYYFDQETYHT